jgi:hypothetical protein
MAAQVMDAIARHSSELWNSVPDSVQNDFYVLYGMLGCMFIIAATGVMKRKKWGYAFTVSLNYVLATLTFMPLIGIALYCFKSGLPFFEIPLEYVTPNIFGVIVSVVCLVFALLIRRKSVSSVFESM